MANPLPSSPSTEQLLLDLGRTLFTSCPRKDIFQELAPLLWHSSGIIYLLLQEIIKVYPYLYPPTFTLDQSKRVCNAILLLQCFASHDETRRLFLSAQITMYLLPLIKSSSKSNAFEYMRQTSLEVIRELVKAKDKEVIRYLIATETVPICFHAIDYGTELSKTVGTFIIQEMLDDDLGLEYIGNSEERFFSLNAILTIMVAEIPSPELLKIIIRCYLRLTDNHISGPSCSRNLPPNASDGCYLGRIDDDLLTMLSLHQLLRRVGVLRIPPH